MQSAILWACKSPCTSVAGMPEAATELGLGEVLAAAQLKLSAALPTELRSRAGRVRERFLLDPLAWFREADSVPWLATVARAVWDEHRIEMPVIDRPDHLLIRVSTHFYNTEEEIDRVVGFVAPEKVRG